MKFSIIFDSIDEFNAAMDKLNAAPTKAAVKPEPTPEPTPELTPACKTETASKPKGKKGFGCKPFTVALADCLWVGTVISKKGHICAVGAVKATATPKYRLGLIDKDCEAVNVNGFWWIGEDDIILQLPPTFENAFKIMEGKLADMAAAQEFADMEAA